VVAVPLQLAVNTASVADIASSSSRACLFRNELPLRGMFPVYAISSGGEVQGRADGSNWQQPTETIGVPMHARLHLVSERPCYAASRTAQHSRSTILGWLHSL